MTAAQAKQVREAALRCLADRKAHRPHHRIQNGMARAGTPMYYYCDKCGWLAAILHELHICPVPKYCYDCQWMIEQGYTKP